MMIIFFLGVEGKKHIVYIVLKGSHLNHNKGHILHSHFLSMK